MNRIILIFITLVLCSLASYSQYDYSQYLRQAMTHLDKGDTVHAKDNYEVYTTMTGKTSPEFEKKLEALRRLRKNVQPASMTAADISVICKARGDSCYNKKKYSESITWYQLSADNGNVVAQCRLGDIYIERYPKRTYECGSLFAADTVTWTITASCIYRVSVMCDDGCGVKENDVEAAKWYRKSAEHGYAVAQNKLGYMYLFGKGVDADSVEAVKWWRKSAEQGNMYAQYNLAAMYFSGGGVEKSDVEVVKWLLASSEQGYAAAQNNLGFMYEGGCGVKRNRVEAVKWYRKSAEQGYADAQYNLAYKYESGKGVDKDLSEAIKWYRAAAKQGNQSAKDALKRLGVTE